MSRLDPYRDRGLPQRLPGTPGPPEPPVSERVALIVLAVVAMGGAVFALQRSSATSIAATEVPEAEVIAPPVRPIDTEAQVFRVRPGMFASPEDAGRRPTAHPRTLATYRGL